MDTMRQNLMDTIDFIQSIIKQMTRSLYMEVCVIDAHLYMLVDHAVLYHIDLSNKIDPSLIVSYHNLSDDFSAIIEDNNIITTVTNKYLEIRSIELYNNKIYENNDIRSDPEFNKLINMKASDGASFYYINTNNNITPFIPIFSGLPIVNKPDSVALELYDIGQHKILVHMIIYKAKLKKSYDLYYKILDVNRPMGRGYQ